jgi:hypothetical protein
MVSFLAMLLGLTALLSIARQVRLRLAHYAAQPVANAADDTLPAPQFADAAPTKPSAVMLEQVRTAVRDAASDPVTLVIEPDSGPTRQQRTVQRLIEYLKEESAAAPVSPV